MHMCTSLDLATHARQQLSANGRVDSVLCKRGHVRLGIDWYRCLYFDAPCIRWTDIARYEEELCDQRSSRSR